MRAHGRLPLLETVEKGERIVCDENLMWLRAMRIGETEFLGVALERIEAGWSGQFLFMDDDAPDDVGITRSHYARYAMFLPRFADYVAGLGPRKRLARELRE